MNEADTKRVLEISKVMRDELRTLMDTYGDEIASINNRDDPHIPVIEWLQLNFMQAATEYLVENGVKPEQALDLTVLHAGASAKHWFSTIKNLRGSKYALNK
jgi:hypothetical protein